MSEFEAFKKTLSCLELLTRRGYFLHGSQIGDIEQLTPRQACDLSRKEENNLCAVYAVRAVQVPIVRALMAGRGTTSWRGNDDYLSVTGNRTFAPGWVYVLPGDTFEKHGQEWVSFRPVRPIMTVPVTPTALRVLVERGTLHLQIPIPAPW